MALLRDMKLENVSVERFGEIPLWGLKRLYFFRVLSPLNILIICSKRLLGALLSVVTDERKKAVFFFLFSLKSVCLVKLKQHLKVWPGTLQAQCRWL